MRLSWFWLALCLAGCGSEVCTTLELGDALAAARPGDVVEVGACRIAGAFVVPDGVTLEGRPGAVLASVDDGAAPIVQTTIATSVQVRGLRFEVDHGGVAIRARGGGSLLVSDITVVVSRGIGIGLDAAGATLTRVRLEGPIDASNALSAPTAPSETGAFGLVGRDLGMLGVTLEATHIEGFAVAGASFDGGVVTWRGADAGADLTGNRGFGLVFVGSDATLTSVEIERTLSGVGLVGVGIAVSVGDRVGHLEANALVVRDGEGYGLFSSASDVVLADADFLMLSQAGVRLQRGTLEATDLTCMGNGGAGVLAIDATMVDIERGVLDAQRMAPLVSGVSTVTAADGIEVVRDPMSVGAPPLSVRLVDVAISANPRTGLLLDAADGPLGSLVLERVDVEASGMAFGAVAQRTTLPGSWDAMVARRGAATVNDAAFSSISAVGIMMPPGFPPPDF